MDDAVYNEMKELPALYGSLNAVVSVAHRLKRPPSLSESFAWTPENVERAVQSRSSSNTQLNMMVVEASAQTLTSNTEERQSICSFKLVDGVLRLTFHLTLISVFETLFFFFYVSTMENSGIQRTVGGFVNDAVTACMNFTAPEKVIVNDLLSAFINATIVVQTGEQTYLARTVYNKALLNQAWIYVGGLSGFFILLVGFARCQKIAINWRSVLLENIVMISLLGLYEYVFFMTIITPYQPLTANEIAMNAVESLQSQCGIL
jgi:hypothetical protein